MELWWQEQERNQVRHLRFGVNLEQNTAPPTSPNDRPGLALIGCGGQGSGDRAGAARFGNVVALSDVKENALNNVARRYTQGGKAPATFSDFRKILERKDDNNTTSFPI
jgi:hypothetical protein